MTADVVAPACIPMPVLGRARRVFETLGAVAQGALRVRLRCLVLGHDDSFAREPRRLMLRCTACGRETVGWAIGPGAPPVVAASRVPAGRKTGLDTAVRVGPWTLRPRDGRGAARERERQRLVAAAARAAEQRDDGGEAPGRLLPVGRRSDATATIVPGVAALTR